MATKQGYLKEKGSQDKLAPKTLDSLVKDSARNRALSASLQELAERQCLGYPPFATTQNYTVGDKVFYDRKLWKFTSSHTAGAWNASHVTAWSVEDEVSELKLAVTALDERKANIDGFYEGMGVGVAKRLEGNTDVAGSFLERTTGGDAELANGLAQLNEVQGGSVKFNQLTTKSENIITLSASETFINDDSTPAVVKHIIVGHKYLFSCDIVNHNPEDIIYLFGGSSFTQESNRVRIIHTSIKTKDRPNTFAIKSYASSGEWGFKNLKVFDLTAIFGAGNEPSTVAEFEEWLAENVGLKDYYDYTDGEVVNNNMTGIESNGFNLFNPTTGKARIIGAYSEVYGNYYGITGTHGTLTFEDDLGNVSTITPDADGKLEFDVPGYINVADAGNDVAVFLWWDGKKTEYEDYDVEIAHLDVRHIYGKKNGTGELVQVWPTGMPRINDVIDKLCIENGAVVAKRPIGEVDMGTLNWVAQTAYAITSKAAINAKIGATKLMIGHGIQIIPSGIATTTSAMSQNDIDINVNIDGDGLHVASSVSGFILYFELATPETYTDLVYMGSEYFADGTPVALPVNYKVDNWGVETILPKNTSTILTAKPTIKVRYAIDAVEQLDTHSDEIEDLYDGLDELDSAKANTVGVYDDMVVGAAKAIAGNQRLDKEFTSMVVEGADGVAKINEVRGKSLVWNQLMKSTDFNSETKDGLTFTKNADGSWTIDGTANADGYKALSDSTIVQGSRVSYIKAVEGGSATTYYLGYNSIDDSTLTTRIKTQNYNTYSDARLYYKSGTVINNLIVRPQLIDLTQMFGAGNEPATVEEFEALFPNTYYEYNDGEIINNATEELDIYDSEETLKSTLPLNLTTITGKQVGVEDAESEVIFPDGMRQAGNVADTLIVDDDGYARRALVKVGSVDLGTLTWSESPDTDHERQIGIGVESVIKHATSTGVVSSLSCSKYIADTPSRTYLHAQDKTVCVNVDGWICVYDSSLIGSTAAQIKTAMNGAILNYELAEYKEYILDEPILMTFKAYHGGTIVQSPQAPDSAPMSMNVTFALDAVGTLNNLPQDYISADSMDAFLAQLGTAMNGTWTKSWDAANNRYGFTFTPNA